MPIMEESAARIACPIRLIPIFDFDELFCVESV